MEMYTDKLGWVAAVLFLICCSYFLLKRVFIRYLKPKFNLRQALNVHCYTAIAATIIAILHVGNNIAFIGISAGFICLFSMILLTVSGIIMKYFKFISPKTRRMFVYIHILLTIIFVLSLSYHIYSYHIQL